MLAAVEVAAAAVVRYKYLCEGACFGEAPACCCHTAQGPCSTGTACLSLHASTLPARRASSGCKASGRDVFRLLPAAPNSPFVFTFCQIIHILSILTMLDS